MQHTACLVSISVMVDSSAVLFNLFSPADQNNAFVNSVDPDKTAHNELSHQDLHCLPCHSVLISD